MNEVKTIIPMLEYYSKNSFGYSKKKMKIVRYALLGQKEKSTSPRR